MQIDLPKRPTRLDFLLNPFRAFLHIEASSGILLLSCAVIAMIWANSGYSESYFALFQTPISVSFGDAVLTLSLQYWINDLLMAVFFFVVGLEIKREFLTGELSNRRLAALPMAAAIGGMVVPALFYVLLNRGTDGIVGWGVPMATDIAFALGVITLLGKRVPVGVKVFLVALAIVDDLGAVLVIALFYTSSINGAALGAGAALFGLLCLMNWAGIRNIVVYTLLGFLLWCAFLSSGVHATIAGVLFALTIPSRPRLETTKFINEASDGLKKFQSAAKSKSDHQHEAQQAAVVKMINSMQNVDTPLRYLEMLLAPWVSFVVMPIFALANAGVKIGSDITSVASHPISVGVMLGLIFGKQIGVTGAAWIVTKLGIASLPKNANWMIIYGTSWLAGIGFTMSLFIANLAFGEGENLVISKVGILGASLIAGLIGFFILYQATGSSPTASTKRSKR